jgi:RNA polymerase sigma factor (sigma-70 family)
VVREQGPTVMRVCRALLDPADAEDAWSETFVAAMQAYPRLRPDSNIRGWLVTIAHRKAIDLLRRTARAGHGSGDPVEVAAEERNPIDRDDELRAAVEALPFKQRWAVIYRHLADLSYADIGALLECSEAAARRNTADGIAKLRAQMKGEGR